MLINVQKSLVKIDATTCDLKNMADSNQTEIKMLKKASVTQENKLISLSKKVDDVHKR